MTTLAAITSRIEDLIGEAPRLTLGDPENDVLPNSAAVAACVGWITAAVAIIEVACSAPESPYRRQAEAIRQGIESSGYVVHYRLRELAEILKRLKADIDDGLLVSIESRVSAETFDDLLDHAEAYFQEQRKEPSGIIAGVVFEDTIRRICRKHQVAEAKQSLDSLIGALKGKGILSKLDSKTAVMAAGLRTHATHAQWADFKLEDVRPVIDFTRRLLREHLDS